MNPHTVKKESTINPPYIEFSDGRRIAYHLSEGDLPGVVFLGGFHSDMTGTKAVALETFCRSRGQRFLRFDYTGHGQSSGNFIDGTIGGWKRDAVDMLDNIVPGKNILVGSSMGGWIMLLAALERTEHVAGLVGIASAPDFTEMLLWDTATDVQKQQLLEKGIIDIPSCYGQEPYPISYQLIEEGRKHLLLGDPIALNMPVRLIHGTRDEDVPWQVSASLLECLTSSDVTLTLVKGAGHRLSEPGELALVYGAINSFPLEGKQ